MHCVIIFGPPAVGKMAVGKELQELTGIRLFHNHASIEPILNVFPFGSPAFSRIVNNIRRDVFAEAAHSELPGLSFTFVWDLDSESDREFLSWTCETFHAQGAEIGFVELKATLDERVIRNRSPERLREKPSMRDLEAAEARLMELEERHRMNSDGELPLSGKHIVVDTTRISAREVAEEIVSRWGLDRV